MLVLGIGYVTPSDRLEGRAEAVFSSCLEDSPISPTHGAESLGLDLDNFEMTCDDAALPASFHGCELPLDAWLNCFEQARKSFERRLSYVGGLYLGERRLDDLLDSSECQAVRQSCPGVL